MKMPPAPVSVTTATPQTKPTRPREILDPPRQVHFAGDGTKIPVSAVGPPKTQQQGSLVHGQHKPSSAAASQSQKPSPPQQKQSEGPSKDPEQQESTQPQSFPGIGHFPGAGQPGLQWHRSVVPGQSLSSAFPASGSHLPNGHNTFSGPPGHSHPHINGCFSPFSPQLPTPLATPPTPHPTTFF